MSDFALITADKPLILVGCGKMGGALLRGWFGRGLDPSAVRVVEPEIARARADLGADSLPASAIVGNAADLGLGLAPAIIILAVKPQMMDEALAPLASYADKGCVFLSIAAGKTIGYFEEKLGERAAIIRAMPNTPAAIGVGMTVACSNRNVQAEQKAVAAAMMAAVGRFAWLDDESFMDGVTAVSGSGPAYVFYLAECLAAAGKSAGLPDELARTLAVQTVVGAGALMAASGGDPALLRRNVTSPKGTTEAALDILMAKDGLAPLLRKAVMAAAKRSRELSE
jgi:pyrroline-5-carboxylate reductase